jgi:hypothetical protein
MKACVAILFTIGLLAICYIISALVYFDLTWILIWTTSLWAAIDSAKIKLNRYKLGCIACRPVVLFCLCALFWIFVFPWYLWARLKIKNGGVVLKEDAITDPEQQPIRRFFRKLARITQRGAEWTLIGLVSLKIVFLLFCLEECWRGQRVWENYKHELEAKGEIFDWDAMIPPRVPDAQNFFCAPKMSEWFIKPSKNITITEDLTQRFNYTNSTPRVLIAEVTTTSSGAPTGSEKADIKLRINDAKSGQRIKKLISDLVGPCALGMRSTDMVLARPSGSNQIRPLHVILEADQKPTVQNIIALLNNNSGPGPLMVIPDGTNSFHVLTHFCSASDYLKWSDQFENDFVLMREATKRPYARMDGDYHYPPTIPIPNYVNLRSVFQMLAQRAQCQLLLGKPDKALQELTLLNNLRHLLEGAPTGKPMTLVAVMINAAAVGLYTDAIADGFRLHAWKEPQIVMLQKQLGEINLAPFLKESLHEEEVSAWRIIQTMMLEFEVQHIPNATLWQKIKNLRPPNILRGFFYFNVVNAIKMEQMIFDSIDIPQKVVLPQKTSEFQYEVETLNHSCAWPLLPYKFFAALVVPDFTKAVQTFAFDQTKSDEAKIVCALERYYLAHGNYPETLNELEPLFIDELPHDIIGGRPLKYHHTPDGQFTLYSIGWNATDDDGQFLPSSHDKGDWVWQ